VMDTENSHGGGPISQSTLTSEKETCGAHFTSDRSGPGMPCEAPAVYLPTLLAPAGLFAEELSTAFRLLHSVSRMEATLKIRAGYDIAFDCFQEVPMLLMLSVHPSRQQDLLTDHVMRFTPNVQARDFSDAFRQRMHPPRRPSRPH
jgi:hypothetical protein